MTSNDSSKPPEKKKRFSLDPQNSSHGGIFGLFETLLRRFKIFMHLLSLIPLYMIASFCLAVGIFPALLLVTKVWSSTVSYSLFVRVLAASGCVGLGFFLFAFSLMTIVPLVNFVLPTRLHAWKGPYYSLHTVKWYMHNGLTYLVRLTVLEFFTPTPYNILFYRCMGMKIGDNCQINSTHISDPCLITIGKKVTIGGSATVIGHYGVGGLLVLAPVVIGDGATIGLKATVMGGVEIGAGAKVLSNSVVLPKTVIPAGETWGGVPAKKIELT